METILCGIDWAETHHDVALIDGEGHVLARHRIRDDATGFGALVGLFADHDVGPGTVNIAIETEQGLLVAALRAAGYEIFAINPKSVDRYRDRHRLARGKSDAADAVVLAHILRTDVELHRSLPADSDTARAIEVLARAHQDAVRARQQDTNRLRSLLKQYFPAVLAAFPDMTTNTALAVLQTAPTPSQAAELTEQDLIEVLITAGRGRRRSQARRLVEVFAAAQLHQPPAVEQAMGTAATALVATIAAQRTAINDLEHALDQAFDQHPDAEIYTSMPGLGLVLSARVLGEFGDDRTRWNNPASMRAYAGTAPITRQSGKKRSVHARFICNQRLHQATRAWAYSALTRSPGARAYYDQRRTAGDGHEAALRRLSSKLLGQLHHCLTRRQPYNENQAWPPPPNQTNQAAA